MTARPLTARRVVRGVARRFPRAPFRFVLPYGVLRGLFRFWLSVLAAQPDHRAAVRQLLVLESDTRRSLDQAAIAYNGGVHAKHRLTRYHDFFVERVRPGERVLDVGAGKGELAYDLVVRAGAQVVGVDNNPWHVRFARSRFRHERLQFVEADVLEATPAGPVDVVVLSNVLEHFEHRSELLRTLLETCRPSRVLLRVPVYARDWSVPLREEVGLPHFSDATHHVEYTEAGFRAELQEAGLDVTELLLVWGEIWAVAEPARR